MGAGRAIVPVHDSFFDFRRTVYGFYMQKKYQVFISSTFRDLFDERQDTLKSVLDMGHIPSGMEVFPAVDLEQFEYIKKIIDECDYYVLIIGARYGSTDDAGMSFTEKEYRYAVEKKKSVLGFIHNDLGNLAVSKTDTGPELALKLDAFRKSVASNRLVQFWKDREELKSKVIISLHKAISEFPATGWMRADAAASEDLLAQINKLRLENEDLRAKTRSELEGLELEDLADIESKFTLRYSHIPRSSLLSVEAQASASWKMLFLLAAPQFLQPVAHGIEDGPFGRALKERRLIPDDRRRVHIFSTDLHTIETQLHAYGLLTSKVTESVEGQALRFRELSPLGRRKQIEWSIVRQS